MHFGLDIGSFSIKIIQCAKKGNKYSLLRWGEARSSAPLDSIERGDRIKLGETLKKLVHDTQITTNNVVVALSEKQVFSRVIQLPFMSEAELASAIEFEAEQYIPLPLEQVQLEHIILKTPSKDRSESKMDVLLIAAQKKAIELTTSLVEMAGLVPLVLETEVLALGRSLGTYADTSLLVNIGKDSTDLIIVTGTELKFVYSFPAAGETLTRAVSQALSLDLLQAEEYKKAYGLNPTILEGKVASALTPAFNQIANQILKAINFYMQKYTNDPIRRLVLAGGTAEMPGIGTYLTKFLNIETVLGSPFVQFEKDRSFPPLLEKQSSRFATAVGQAMREV